MDDDKFDELYRMTEENNRMLRSMRRSALVGGVVKFIFWVIVLVVIPYYAWQYLQPYMQEITKLYQEIHGTSASVQTDSSSFFSGIQQFFSQFGTTTPK